MKHSITLSERNWAFSLTCPLIISARTSSCHCLVSFIAFFLPKSNLLWEALGALLVTIITTYNARQLLVGLKFKKILVYTVH